MLQIHLGDGRTLERIAAGFIATPDDLARFVADATEELKHLKKGQSLLVEAWETVSQTTIKARRIMPTEQEEMSATQER